MMMCIKDPRWSPGVLQWRLGKERKKECLGLLFGILLREVGEPCRTGGNRRFLGWPVSGKCGCGAQNQLPFLHQRQLRSDGLRKGFGVSCWQWTGGILRLMNPVLNG